MKKIIALTLFVATFNANAALLDGKTIGYSYFFPNTSTPYSPDSNNGNHLVGAGIELGTDVGGTNTSMDISDTNLLIDFSGNTSWTSTTFNGFRITDVFNNIDDFTSVSINAATNMAGLTLDRITVLSNEIWVNWQGLSFNGNSIVSLDINSTPSAVPVPAAAFLFAPALLGFMGLRRKAKNSVA